MRFEQMIDANLNEALQHLDVTDEDLNAVKAQLFCVVAEAAYYLSYHTVSNMFVADAATGEVRLKYRPRIEVWCATAKDADAEKHEVVTAAVEAGAELVTFRSDKEHRNDGTI